MKVGDVVVHKRGPFSGGLVSGCEMYTHAICVQVNPMILVSEGGDMKWMCQDANDFIGLCEVSPEARAKAYARYERDYGKAPS